MRHTHLTTHQRLWGLFLTLLIGGFLPLVYFLWGV